MSFIPLVPERSDKDSNKKMTQSLSIVVMFNVVKHPCQLFPPITFATIDINWLTSLCFFPLEFNRATNVAGYQEATALSVLNTLLCQKNEGTSQFITKN